MRILYDGQQLDRRMTGVGYYSDRVLRGMLALDTRHEWVVLCHAGNAAYLDEVVSDNTRVRKVVLRQPVSLHFSAQQDMLRRLIPEQGAQLYFSPSFLSVPRDVCACVSAVHDATFVLYPEFHGAGIAKYLHDCVTDTCVNASRIVTMSENSQRDICRFYRYPAAQLRVIPLAADREFFIRRSGAEIAVMRAKYDLPERYVLAVNMGNPKKNAPLLFKAFAGIAPDARSGWKLAVAGEWSPDALHLPNLARAAGLDGQVLITGHVPREDLGLLYSGASLFCFPSLHEGFGLPVLEAMAAGVPVISSNAASLPEVAGDAAVLLDPDDEIGWTAAMGWMMADEGSRHEYAARGREQAAGFDWEKTARATLDVIGEVLQSAAVPAEVSAMRPEWTPVEAKGLICAVTVDDVRPAPGFGGRQEKDALGMLLELHREFGVKFTLFVPTNWQGRWPVSEHLDWLGWLLEQPCFEVACHGHLHAVGVDNPDPGEFRGIAADRLDEMLVESLNAFALAGHKPLGIRPPGWFLEPSAYDVFNRRFSYVADHVAGQTISRLARGTLLRFPYLYTIDDLGAWPEKGLAVLHSHIAPEGRTTNGWTAALHERMKILFKTGRRLGVRFATLGELAKEMSSPASPVKKQEVARISSEDSRLRGGSVKILGDQAGVLYHGSSESCALVLRPEDASVVILSRNRRDYLLNLLQSIDETGPKDLGRIVLLNNSEDDSAESVRQRFPNWRVMELNDADHPEEPAGLAWLKANMLELLPRPRKELGATSGWTNPRSIAWLRNRQFAACGRDFLVSFDDDFVVKPGWWEYYVRFQREYCAHAVINNFGAFVMCRTVPERIGWMDERFLASHGFEDNDYAARMAEGKIRWVLGFNPNHDWRSAEEANPRGSMTGADYFIHRYVLKAGGYAARRDEAKADPLRASWNERWYHAKWEETAEDTGIVPRPPFRGKFLRRRVREEPDWCAQPRMQSPVLCAAAVKLTENTPVSEIDPLANPATGTMMDRYVLAAHWCKGKRVLDAACGHGYGSAILLALGAERVLGVDTDAAALEYAQSRYSGPRMAFRRYDLVHGQPAELGLFETVVSIETMEHLPREAVESYLVRLRSHLATGGTALITTPRRSEIAFHYQGGTHRYEYAVEEFRQVIQSAFPGAVTTFLGITEFRVHDEPRLYSRMTPSIDAQTRIMMAVVQTIARR